MTASKYDTYTSPLAERNASPEMLCLWSPRHKFNTWRKIWLAVAEAQHELTTLKGTPSASSAPGSSSPTSSPSSPPPLVTADQLAELRAVVNRPGGITDEEMKAAEKYERELRHDVMAHVHALGDSCPKAKGIIHLGMTSQDVVCNADILLINEARRLVETKIARLLFSLAQCSAEHKRIPSLGFTHYQPAQPLTVGRRIAQWAMELSIAMSMRVGGQYIYSTIDLKGLRGATGTQASFLSLLNGDGEAVDELEQRVMTKLLAPSHTDEELVASGRSFADELHKYIERCEADGKAEHGKHHLRQTAEFYRNATPEQRRQRITDNIDMPRFALSGQTYPRVIDTFILADLASTASVLHKIATDIRLLCNRKELDEPFETKQIGSSAMPYKRNPMRCERICGLTRFVMNLVGNAYDTAATQWLERTLDDSSNRRLSLPEAFLALDGALDLMHNVASGLIIHEAMVKKNLMAELPFMATENIMMACVKLGGDRQHYHELIRVHAQAAGTRVKDEGLDNDLLDRLKNDQNFWSTSRGGPLSAELDWRGLLDPMKYIGRSVEQTDRFIKEVVEPLRVQYGEAIARLGESGPKV